MEQRFRHDFLTSAHTGTLAEQSADIGAQAYTVGSNIVFGGNHFKPETGEGQRLIAHELTHTIQHAKSSTRQVNRFVEREHKNLGNRAATEFPYFATLTTDEVALRTSPQGRKTDNKFYNLNVSLRKDARLVVVGKVSKWMRVLAQSGTPPDANAQVNPGRRIKRPYFKGTSGEGSGVFDQQPRSPGLDLTYGDFTALSGDHLRSS
jgi:hypothetical protein